MGIVKRFTLGCALVGGASMGWAQAGTWVLDGWPDQKSGYFAGRTEIYADGDRLKITEWPEHTEDDTQTLETYFLGQTVVKVFPWNGSRVGLVFEATEPLPRAERNSEGKLVLPLPFPRCLPKRARFPAERGAFTTSEMWHSSPSMTSCSPRAAFWKTPSNRQTMSP